MLNAALGENKVAVGGLTRLPKDLKIALEELAAFKAAAGDIIIMLDAGHHACDPDIHQVQWQALIEAAHEKM